MRTNLEVLEDIEKHDFECNGGKLEHCADFILLKEKLDITLGESTMPMQVFNFSDALEIVKTGAKVARKGWNGKNMFLSVINPGNASHLGYDMQRCIGMKTADCFMQPGWVPSQQDLFAEDWEIVE